jgi:hypothetical protein
MTHIFVARGSRDVHGLCYQLMEFRTIGLPDQLVALLPQHLKDQAAERELGAQL